MRRRPAPIVLLLAATAALDVGCRGCADGARDRAEASGPTMPVGLLAPLPDGAGAGAAARFALLQGTAARDPGTGWIELQRARDGDGPERSAFERGLATSSYLSADAMTFLHDAFARALPGFDPFLPHFFDRDALGRLVRELVVVRADLARTTSLAGAKDRWGASSTVAGLADDAAWDAARTALLRTIEGLSALAAEGVRDGRGLWVLGI